MLNHVSCDLNWIMCRSPDPAVPGMLQCNPTSRLHLNHPMASSKAFYPLICLRWYLCNCKIIKNSVTSILKRVILFYPSVREHSHFLSVFLGNQLVLPGQYVYQQAGWGEGYHYTELWRDPVLEKLDTFFRSCVSTLSPGQRSNRWHSSPTCLQATATVRPKFDCNPPQVTTQSQFPLIASASKNSSFLA